MVLAPRIPDLSGGATAMLTLGEELARRGRSVSWVSIWPGRAGRLPRVGTVVTVHRNEELHRRPLLRDPGVSMARRIARVPLFAGKKLSLLAARRHVRTLFDGLGPESAVIVAHSDALGVVRSLGVEPARSPALWIGQHHSQFAALEHEPGLRTSIIENYRDVDAFVALTAQDRDDFAQILPCPTSAIPNPVAPPPALSSGIGGKQAVALARLSPEKQHDLMIRAFTRAVRSGALDGWHLVIRGEGPLRPQLKALVRQLGAQDIIDLAGPAPGPAEAFADASVHLLTSAYEGFPMAAVEAAWMGVPTVALDCSPGLREIITPSTGSLVSPLTEEAFADALREHLADEALLQEWSRSAPRSATRFAPGPICDRWERLITESGRRPRSGTRTAVVWIPRLHARGGAEKYSAHVARALVDEGWDVVLATHGAATLVADGQYLGVDLSPVTPLDIPETSSRLPRALAELLRDTGIRRRIRRLDADLLVTCGYKSELPGCARRSIYICHFPHRMDVRYEGRARTLYMRILGLARGLLAGGNRSFLSTYDAFVANSRYTQHHMRERWGVESRVLHPPCAPQSLPGLVRRRQILSVGRFERIVEGAPHKSQHVLVEAFRDLRSLHREGWELHLAGTVSPGGEAYLAQLRVLAEGLPVIFHPDASPEELADLYGHSRIYWHAQGFGRDADAAPETQEHFGMTTVEALSAGVLPVVIGTAGPAEVMEGIQGISTWSTPDALRAETLRLAALPDDELDRLSQECRRRAMDFDVATFTEGLRSLLDDVAGQLGP